MSYRRRNKAPEYCHGSQSDRSMPVLHQSCLCIARARLVFLYREGTKVGEARQVNLFENASAKRKGRGRPAKQSEQEDIPPVLTESGITEPAVSFTTIFASEKEKNNPGGTGDA